MKQFFKTLWERMKTSLPEKTLPMGGKATTPFTDGNQVNLPTWQPEVKAAVSEQNASEAHAQQVGSFYNHYNQYQTATEVVAAPVPVALEATPVVEPLIPEGPVLTQIVHSPATETAFITDTTTEGNPIIEVPVIAVKKPRKRKPKATTSAPENAVPVPAPKANRKPKAKKAE